MPRGARDENVVQRQQVGVVLVLAREVVEEGADGLEPAFGDRTRHAAHPHITDGKPRAGNPLKKVVERLAFAEGVKEHRHRAQFQGMGPQPEQMAGNARQFAENRAQELAAFGNFDAEQFLHRADIGEVVGHRREVIESVGIGDEFVVGFGLGQLFLAAVQVADGWPQGAHGFAFQVQHQAQHAVRRGVLRPHVKGHQFGAGPVLFDRAPAG